MPPDRYNPANAPVNFFGHALIARSRRRSPLYVLGSMLPDFLSMARLRAPEIESEELREGVQMHHDTDDAFHGAPSFLRLMHEAQDELEAAGVPYGGAMAVGHVGVELLLDGWLVREHGVDPIYRDALRAEPGPLRWRERDERPAARWRTLRARLREAPVPEAYQEPSFVADRLVRILDGRPRLALDAKSAAIVAEWAPRARPRVEAGAPELLEEVESRLAAIEARAAGTGEASPAQA